MPERTNQVDHLDRGRDGWVHCPAAEKEDSSISEVSSVSQVSSVDTSSYSNECSVIRSQYRVGNLSRLKSFVFVGRCQVYLSCCSSENA